MSCILLTGAGGAAVCGLIERLRSKGHRVIAADMDPYAVGLHLGDVGYVIPPGTSHQFLPTLRWICRKEKVDVVVPLVDEELLATLELERDGTAVLLPRREFVAICLDKFRLMEELRAVGIRTPETRLANDVLGDMQFPVVVKPRVGRGSRGLRIVNDQAELHSIFDSNLMADFAREEIILQSHIDGTEFTVSVIVWRDGEVQAVVPKEIIFKKGTTRLAVTRHNARIDALCRQIQSSLRADGPFNVQLRLDAETGEPIPFEINPRFSGTVGLTIAAGVDEVGDLIAQAVGNQASRIPINWREGIVLLRRTTDEFMDESWFQSRQIIILSAGCGS